MAEQAAKIAAGNSEQVHLRDRLRAKHLAEQGRAVPPHLLPGPDDPAEENAIDLRTVRWLDLKPARGSNRRGLFMGVDKISLPMEPFAEMRYLRLGTSTRQPDLLILQFSAEPMLGAVQRQKGGHRYGGGAIVRQLLAFGLVRGQEYPLVEFANCWAIRKP